MSAKIVYFSSHACTQAVRRCANFEVKKYVAFDISKDFSFITTEYRYEDANFFDYFIERVTKEIICVAQNDSKVSTVLTDGSNYMRMFCIYNSKQRTHYARDTAQAKFVKFNKK